MNKDYFPFLLTSDENNRISSSFKSYNHDWNIMKLLDLQYIQLKNLEEEFQTKSKYFLETSLQ
jgi:hypothetical protein